MSGDSGSCERTSTWWWWLRQNLHVVVVAAKAKQRRERERREKVGQKARERERQCKDNERERKTMRKRKRKRKKTEAKAKSRSSSESESKTKTKTEERICLCPKTRHTNAVVSGNRVCILLQNNLKIVLQIQTRFLEQPRLYLLLVFKNKLIVVYYRGFCLNRAGIVLLNFKNVTALFLNAVRF